MKYLIFIGEDERSHLRLKDNVSSSLTKHHLLVDLELPVRERDSEGGTVKLEQPMVWLVL